MVAEFTFRDARKDDGRDIAEEEGVESQTIGFLLTYTRDFSAP